PQAILRVAVLVVVVAVLAWAASRMDWPELGRRLAGASPGSLAAMLFAWLAGLLVRPVRFRYLLKVLGHVQGADYRTVWAGMVLGIAGLFGVLRWRAQVIGLLDRVLARLAPRWQARGHDVADEVLSGLAEIGHWRTTVPLVLISAVIWGLTWLSYTLGLYAVQ